MKHEPRTFNIAPAVRLAGNIKVGLFAPSGGGKTFSALRLASGIQSVVGGDIGVLDTENRRATHYSGRFKFQHIDFKPPFGSLDYADGIKALEAAGCRTIIVDSMSHEHDGPGGMLEAHEAEVDRLAGDGASYQRRESVKMLAWKEPKGARRRLLRAIVESNANMILCFRAKESAKPVVRELEGGRKKTEVVQLGFVPIAGDEFVFEMDIAALLLPGAKGVATWSSDQPGERMMIKVPDQFDSLRAAYREKALDEELGARLAKWAVGGAAKAEATSLSDASAPKPGENGGTTEENKTPESPPAQEEQREPEAGTEGATTDSQAGLDLETPAEEPTAGEAPADDPQPETPPVEEANPFAVYAAEVAKAAGWGPIKEALATLTRTEAYKAADDGYRARAREIAWHRNDELRTAKFEGALKDILDDPQGFLCWMMTSSKVDEIVGSAEAIERQDHFKVLSDGAKTAFRGQVNKRLEALRQAAGTEEFA